MSFFEPWHSLTDWLSYHQDVEQLKNGLFEISPGSVVIEIVLKRLRAIGLLDVPTFK